MRALVTGGAGFIGSHLVDALVRRGDQVTVVDDLSRGRRIQVNEAAVFHQVDATTAELNHVLVSSKPEVVFHLAAQIDVRRSVREPLFDTTSNVVGTVNVLQAAVDTGVRRVVFASSGGAIYGDTDLIPTPEEFPPAPASNYGAAKACGETYGGVYSRMYGLQFVALRYANVYGPRQDPHGEAGVVAIFAQRLLVGEQAVINGDGTQSRDYVHVRDVVAANLAAIDGPAGAYNIGTSRECDVNAMYALVARACGVTAPPTHGAAKPGEQRRSCLDVSRARSNLKWEPMINLDEGIPETVDFFRSGKP